MLTVLKVIHCACFIALFAAALHIMKDIDCCIYAQEPDSKSKSMGQAALPFLKLDQASWINEDNDTLSISSVNGSLRMDVKPASNVNETVAPSPWSVISTDFIPIKKGVVHNYSLSISANNSNLLHSKVIYYDLNKNETFWKFIFGGRNGTFNEQFSKSIFSPPETEYVKLQVLVRPSLVPSFYVIDDVKIGLSVNNSLSSPMDNSSSVWVRGANMPTPRTDFTGTVLDDKVYIIGGLNRNGTSLDAVEFYDPKTDSWGTINPLPKGLDHAAAAAYDDKLFVVGGKQNDDTRNKELFIYNALTDEWQKGTPMPTAKTAYGLTANFINGTLYVVGGVDESGPSHSNLAYDPITDAWTEKEPMPTAREHLTSAVVDGKLFVIGGRVAGLESNLDANEVYDPLKDTWNVLEPMPSKRGGLAAAASSPNGTIHVFGGEEPGSTFNNNEKYDPKSDTWTEDIPMPTARHGLAAATIDDKIYVIGGGLEPGLNVTPYNEIFQIDNSTKK